MTAGVQPEAFQLRLTRYVTHDPFRIPQQAAFLALPHLEALYGGAAGGGKSDALLMAALQYVDLPGYAAIIFRRTFPELRMPGGLIPRSMEWLGATDAVWNGEEHKWTFPSGATLSFGHAEHETSVYSYGSSEFQFLGFDEVGTFLEKQYVFMRSRLRRLEGSGIPLRIRAASNPGTEWVKNRFIPQTNAITGEIEYPRDENTGEIRVFIPAKLEDNPFLDREEYRKTLAGLDPVTRARLLAGDWSIGAQGGMFRRGWFPIEPALDARIRYSRAVRRWDLAATPKTATNDPDWTAGAKMVREIARDGRPIIDEKRRLAGRFGILDMARSRSRPLDVEQMILTTAELDGNETIIEIEREPGASGKILIATWQRKLLGYTVRGVPSLKSKELRAGPFSSAAEAGLVFLIRGFWNTSFLEEAEAFPTPGVHDDMVDVAIGGFESLTKLGAGGAASW